MSTDDDKEQEKDNILYWRGVTRLDIEVRKILQWAIDADLETVVVVGTKKDGDAFFASSQADAASVNWELQGAIWALHRMQERLSDDD